MFPCIKWRQFSRGSAKGFTIVELLVAISLGMMMCALSLSAILANRRLYQYDLVRTRLNQNLRSGMDLLGVNIREAGENLSASFPAVELINGQNGAPDELVIRRNLIDEVLKLCQPILAGSSASNIYFAYPNGEAGCAYDDQLHNYDVWKQYREDYWSEHSQHVPVMIYDPSTQKGEFFYYSGEAKPGSTMYVIRSSGSFTNAYLVDQSAMFVMEEWRFKVGLDWNMEPVFQVVQNRETSNPINVTYNVTNFQVQITLKDGSVVQSFGPADNWTNIKSIEVTLVGEEEALGENIQRDYTASFFPRNILSH